MIAMSFMATAYCNRDSCGRPSGTGATICHDSPAECPNIRLTAARFTAPNGASGWKSYAKGVGHMSAHTKNWLPQLFNWLAILVLLSLGVLV
jgi:hypothetical protein